MAVSLASVSVGVDVEAGFDAQALASAVDKSENGVRIKASASFDSIVSRIEVDARAYNVLEVTMKADRGKRCLLKWTSDLEPSLQENPGSGVPIFADNEMHTYRIPLDAYTTETWAGLINKISFSPSDEPANIEIRDMRFLYRPPEGPMRRTVGAQTHEALLGSQPSWEVTVPPNGILDLRIGMLPRAWTGRRHGEARFIVTLDAQQDKEVVLLDQVLTPSQSEEHRTWIPYQFDLSAFAGQPVHIKFTVDHLHASEGDYALWGNPMVYSAVENASTPIILIVCDTVRADHLSCYGYFRETSPYLDAFAREAVLFENAICQETWTLPSHASVFTGLYPKHHGVTANANLPETTLTLAEALRDAGYLTAGYTGFSFWLYPWRGIGHGFDVYNVPDWRFRPINETLAALNGWLDAHPLPNTFIFFHNFDAHSKPTLQYEGLPYGPDDPAFLHFAREFASPPTFVRPGRDKVGGEAFLLAANRGELSATPEETSYCIALYDDSIRMIDRYLHELFEGLKARGLYDQALIIVTSDHGEEFGEHGVYGHANVYEPSARVPLLIRFPHGRHGGARYPHVVQLIDLFPTILSVSGIPIPEGIDGRDLVRVLDDAVPAPGKAYVQRNEWKAVRTDAWKLLRDVNRDVFELYNMARDPAERSNLYETTAAAHEDLKSDLLAFYQTSPEGWHFSYNSSDPEWRGVLEVTADVALEKAILLEDIDKQNMSKKERSVHIEMGRGSANELVIGTLDPDAKLMVAASSDEPFTLLVGAERLQTGDTFSFVLEPTPGSRVQPIDDREGLTSLRIWYVPSDEKRSEAKALSPEAEEELRAIGYMGE